MTRRHIVLRALLVGGAVAIVIFVIAKPYLALAIFRSVWQWLLYIVRLAWVLGRQLLIRLISRWLTNPFWRMIGLGAIMTYAARVAQKALGPRLNRVTRAARARWQACPLYVKATGGTCCVIIVVFFGYSLWLVPFGVPLLMKGATKAQVIFADTWIKRKTLRFRTHFRCFLRRHQRFFFIRWFRVMRYWLFRHERKTTAWVSRKHEWLSEKFRSAA